MRVVSPDNKMGKQAKLEYQTIAYNTNNETVLVSIHLHTGRKHQIRVQFANAQCPIIGDRKYGSKHPFKTGIALQSRFLSLEHPTKKERMTFESHVPKVWELNQFSMLD